MVDSIPAFQNLVFQKRDGELQKMQKTEKAKVFQS
jgi:hypothetical protein